MPGKEVNVPECPSVVVGVSRGHRAPWAPLHAARSSCHAPGSPTDPLAADLGAMGSGIDIVNREHLVALLVDHGQGDALNTVAELGMSADGDQISEAESETLAVESLDARVLDQQLASELGRERLGGSTSTTGYLKGLGERPRLPLATEQRLVRAAKDGDRRAREELVEAFLPLIAGIARVYRSSPTIARVELIQEGVVGLLRALERYDPTLGVPFWGYATWWVRQAMQQLIAELTRPMVLSDRTLRHLAQLKRAHGDYLRQHGHEPTGNQLAIETGFTQTQVGDLLALERIPQSTDEPVKGANDQLGAFGELLADPLAQDAYEQLLDRSEIEQIRALLGSLNERERMILRARYGLDGPEQSLRDIGERIGLSAERVRQIENRALGKLRSAATRTRDTETGSPPD
jgi:RNA polymerase primary sigma factor